MIQEGSTSTHQDKPVSIVAIGAGNRMRTYLHYVQLHPELVQLVAVVDPDAIRRNQIADQFLIPEECRYSDYNDFFDHPVAADAVVLCTPENLHYEPCMRAIEQGYHVLLEKPIAQTAEECIAIAEAARRKNIIVSVCHVLRYHAFFRKIKELIDSGEYGKVISIQHSEGVGLDRMSHSYVRGVMNRRDKGNPMLLAKCCHDVDFLLWLVGSHCRKVSSFGSLRWFKSENAPQGSALRCKDCRVEDGCPFSAIDLYQRRGEWISNFDVPEGSSLKEVLDKELAHGDFGRCVYHCDNDVVDNQTVIMELEDDTIISMTVDVFTREDARVTHICMTNGEISSNESSIRVTNFSTREISTFDFSYLRNKPYHAGADLAVMEKFVKAISQNDGSLRDIPSLIDSSIESHQICYEAERSRLTGQTIELKRFE